MCNNITAVACMIYSLHVNVHKYYRRVRGFYITVWYVPIRYDGYPDGPRKQTKVVHKIVREHTSRVIASNEEEKSNTHKTRCYYGHGACMRTCT